MTFFEEIQEKLNRLVDSIEQYGRRLEEVVGSFFLAFVEFLEKTREWIVDVTTRLKNYLIRLTNAVAHLLWALLKLSLFYLPTIISIVVLFFYPSWWLIGLAIVWFLFVTGIGLTGRLRVP
jgi:hypothetical protein